MHLLYTVMIKSHIIFKWYNGSEYTVEDPRGAHAVVGVVVVAIPNQ